MKMSARMKRGVLIFAAGVLLYLASYCCLSGLGEYRFSQSGSVRYTSGLSVSDVSMWHPKFLRWQRFTTVRGESTSQGNAFGCFYSPLIIIDRWLVHPTARLINPRN